MESLGEQNLKEDPVSWGEGLALLRRRRKYFLGVLIIYLPAMWTVQYLVPGWSYKAIGIWIVLLFAVMMVSAVARCPRCGNYFHLNGMTLLYLRKCLHCQLHINADKTR